MRWGEGAGVRRAIDYCTLVYIIHKNFPMRQSWCQTMRFWDQYDTMFCQANVSVKTSVDARFSMRLAHATPAPTYFRSLTQIIMGAPSALRPAPRPAPHKSFALAHPHRAAPRWAGLGRAPHGHKPTHPLS